MARTVHRHTCCLTCLYCSSIALISPPSTANMSSDCTSDAHMLSPAYCTAALPLTCLYCSTIALIYPASTANMSSALIVLFMHTCSALHTVLLLCLSPACTAPPLH
jgi:hypothetical protein